MAALLDRNRLRKFVAVDFDSDRMRIVHAERLGRQLQVLKLASVEMPEEIDLTDAQAVGGFLGRTLSEMDLRTSQVVMHLPRGQAVLKPITLPPGTSYEEMPDMVRFQVESELPFASAEAVIDFTVTDAHYDAESAQRADDAGVNVLVAAARLPAIDHYRQIAESAGVKLRRLGLRPYANLRCVESCIVRSDEESIALVQVTADETEIDVFAGGTLAFSRSALNRVPASSNADEPDGQRKVHVVVTEVIRSLQSFASVERGRQVDALLVAGDTGIEPRVAEILGERIGVPTEVLDPSGGFRLRSDRNLSSFVSALGLAAGTCESQQLPFDFLNPKRAPEKRDTKRTKVLAAVALAILVLAGGYVLRDSLLSSRRGKVASLYQQREDLRKTAKKTDSLLTRVRSIKDWLGDRPDWLEHLASLSILMPSSQEAYLPDGIRTHADGSISFTLRTVDPKTIREFVKSLEDAGYEYKLGRSTIASRDEHDYYNSYEIRIFASEKAGADLEKGKLVARPADDVGPTVLTQPQPNRARGGRR